MEVIRLESTEGEIFKTIVDWNYHWWGIRDGRSRSQVETYVKHCLNSGNRLPQTFVAVKDGKAIGMYMLSMCDDLESRPDLYPWLINVFVDEKYRHQGVFRFMMQSVKENAAKLKLEELYLYTKHQNLYEKLGWKYLCAAETFRDESPFERIYYYKID